MRTTDFFIIIPLVLVLYGYISSRFLPMKRRVGRPLILSVLAAILLLSLPGCDAVYTTSPLSAPTVIDKEIFEGLWLGVEGQEDGYIQTRFDEHGQLNLIVVTWDDENDKFNFKDMDRMSLILTEGTKYNYMSLRAENDDFYLFAQYTFCEDHVVIWTPDVDAFEEAIKTHELSGRTGGDDVYITSPPETIVQFLNEASAQHRSIYEEEPYLSLRKVMGIDQSQPVISTERCAAEIQYALGKGYGKGGVGLPENKVEAVNWYRKAAKQGYAPAQFKFAVAYYNGIGVPQDDGEVVKWLRMAEEQGHKDAVWGLAWVLSTSPNETIRDGAEAVRFAEAYLKTNNDNVYGLNCLAAAYAEAGRFEDAVEAQKKVLTLNKDLNEYSSVLAKNRLRLWSYLRQEPWRDIERQQN